jgi:hypothetical protein
MCSPTRLLQLSGHVVWVQRIRRGDGLCRLGPRPAVPPSPPPPAWRGLVWDLSAAPCRAGPAFVDTASQRWLFPKAKSRFLKAKKERAFLASSFWRLYFQDSWDQEPLESLGGCRTL